MQNNINLMQDNMAKRNLKKVLRSEFRKWGGFVLATNISFKKNYIRNFSLLHFVNFPDKV